MATLRSPVNSDEQFGRIKTLCQDLNDIYGGLRDQIQRSVDRINSLLIDREEAFTYDIVVGPEGNATHFGGPYNRLGEAEYWLPYVEGGRITSQIRPEALEAYNKWCEHNPLIVRGRLSDFDEVSAAIDTVLDIGRFIAGIGPATQSLFDLQTRVEIAQESRGGGGENDHPDATWTGKGAEAYTKVTERYTEALGLTYSTIWEVVSQVTSLLERISANLSELANLGVQIQKATADCATSLLAALNPFSWLDIVTTLIDAYLAHQEIKVGIFTQLAGNVAGQISATAEITQIAQGISAGWPKVDGSRLSEQSWTPE